MKSFIVLSLVILLLGCAKKEPIKRPNILIAISDDQSWVHTGAYGSDFVNTPNFDRIAEEGALFTNAYAPSPGCAPSRSAIVTGRYPWQNGHAGQHQSTWPKELKTLPDFLEEAGYYCGFTGKGVGPFAHVLSGRYKNPAGPEYNLKHLNPIASEMSSKDYTENFRYFIDQRENDQPFYFWYGSHEPHRKYEAYSGIKHGKKPEEITVPEFLPSSDSVKNDIADYALEIEWFDKHLGEIIKILDSIGELDNTFIIVTSDNGMPFPAAKANCYEYGIHLPFAVRWGKNIPSGRIIEDLISFVDIVPTLQDVAKFIVPDNQDIIGNSFISLLNSDITNNSFKSNYAVYSTRERHSSSRWGNLGYPQRAIRTGDYLYIYNFKPERWPAGYPTHIISGKEKIGFKDVDDTDIGLSARYMINHIEDTSMHLLKSHAFDKRTREELYHVKNDPSCLINLANQYKFDSLKTKLKNSLFAFLERTDDPRISGDDPDIFETYPRYSHIRNFPIPEWIDIYDPFYVDQLIKKVDSDHSPVVKPDSIWDNGLIAGPYKLVIKGNGKSHLYDISDNQEKEVSDLKPSLNHQYKKAFSFYQSDEYSSLMK